MQDNLPNLKQGKEELGSHNPDPQDSNYHHADRSLYTTHPDLAKLQRDQNREETNPKEISCIGVPQGRGDTERECLHSGRNQK